MVTGLILSFLTILYPIEMPNQRMLIETSDLIVKAKIKKVEINSDTTGCVAYLKIIDQIYSNHKNDIEIKIGYNCLDQCDWPAEFKTDEIALIYVKKIKSKKYYINGLSYGISYPDEKKYRYLKKRINDYLECKNDLSRVTWIIDGLNNQNSIEDTKHEFRFYHKQLKRERKSKYFLDIHESINDLQFTNIQSSIPIHFSGRDLSIDLLNHFYHGNEEINKVIVNRIKYYRDSKHKHMAQKFIVVLNSYKASADQLEIENQLSYDRVKNMNEKEVINLINLYLETIK